MKIIDVIKSFNLDEMVNFLYEYESSGDSPWYDWWDENYCSKCIGETDFNPWKQGDSEYAYCELHNKCRYFQDMDEVPDGKQIIRMWLETEDYMG